MHLLFYVISFFLAFDSFDLADNPLQRCRYYPGDIGLFGTASRDEEYYVEVYGNSTIQAYKNAVSTRKSRNSLRAEGLPIWKLLVPGNTIGANISRISDQGKLADPVDVDVKDPQGYNSPFAYSKYVDVTKQAIVSESWYLICVSVRAYFDQSTQTCQHCTVLRASMDEVDQILRRTKVVRLAPPSSRCGSQEGITLEYQIADFPPSERFKIVTKVLKSTANNCQQGESTDYQSVVKVSPNSVAFVNLNLAGLGAGEGETYFVVTTLIFTFDRIVEVDFYLNDRFNRKMSGRGTGLWVLSKSNPEKQWRLVFDP